ncbi:MAG: GyrI-like domain-containing protein [Bacillota bacterium]|nr:GyrI-like domain-containing protein [Bacillota bacterium]
MEHCDYRAEIKEIPDYIVYYKDYFAASVNEFLNLSRQDNFLQDLSDRVLRENPKISLTEPDYNVLIYLEGHYSERNIRYRFCDAVTGFGKDCEEYQFMKLPGCTAVTVCHRGPYETLGNAYGFAKRWMGEHGYVQDGLPRDSAIDGCWNKESEEEYLTEIQIPVRKK